VATVTDNDLTADELKTLAAFQSTPLPDHIDPLHFAKLLSMALVEQKEGGPVLTQTGLERLAASKK
jgi:hypothetical protein